MTNEVLIGRLYNIIDEVTRLGGEQERTSIVPGILVADASPSDLPTGYIKIVNPRDGTYVPCLTVNGLVVSDNDLVNVLFTKGTEPIALSQSAGSPSSSIKVYQLWESDFGAVAWQTDAAGNLSATGAYDLTTTGDVAAADFTVAGFSVRHVIAQMLALPGLRGFWPMSSFNEGGEPFDLSGQGRRLDYNGNPTYNYDGLAPYIDLDGTGDYLSRPDEPALDITGTETFVANPGLTFGGWFWLDSLAGTSVERLIAKDNVSSRSFSIYFQENNDTLVFELHVTTPAVRALASGAVSAQTWFFVAGRFTSGSEQSIFLNGTKTTAARTDTAINNSTAPFEIGRLGNNSQYFTGRASMCFLCGSALSDDIINNLFQQSRILFGV